MSVTDTDGAEGVGVATTVMGTALAAHDAGLSIIPIRNDGSKKPPFSWKQYQTTRADKAELRAWFAPGMYEAAAVVCGPVSGWLVMIEMEGWAWDAQLWPTFREAAVAAIGEARWHEITRYIERSPSGGVHFYVRCPGYDIGNVKLAMRYRAEGAKAEVAMETRGAGGYSVIAPSTGHATGLPWTVAQGVLSDIAEVSHDELEAILAAAGELDESEDKDAVEHAAADPAVAPVAGEGDPPAPSPATSSAGWMDATIEDFNDSTSVLPWLTGWSVYKDDTYNGEPVTRLHRDGSDGDHGALIFQSGRVGFFSSNCPRWAEAYDGREMKSYDVFTVMMWEDHGTNTKEARVAVARQLRAEGFGPPLPEAVLSSDRTDVDPETGEILPSEAVEPSAPRLTLRWVEDALANPPPEPEPVLTNLLRRGEVTVLGAPRAIGKTWASLNLATILARGQGALFGAPCFTPVGPRKVLYLQGELGEWGSATRWEMTQAQDAKSSWPTGMVAETFDRVRIRTTSRKTTTVIEGTVYEDTHVDAVVDHRLEPALVDGAFDVLVIDPWATFFAGSENSNDETEAAILALTDIARRCDIAVWIVHHISAKTQHSTLAEPEDLWRGASRLADAVATRVTVLPHYEPKKARELGMTRQEARSKIDVHVLERNGPGVPIIHSQREGVWWKAWEPPVIGRPGELSQRDITRALRAEPGMAVASKRQLEDLTGKSRSAVDRVLGPMIELGVIETFTGPRNSVGYRLVEVGD